uniref:Uncharacterized protein n=1 Tax=Kalanchoe fedtschenkoi TaxID=63787 RepID=A0A7N0T7P1_KALFE
MEGAGLTFVLNKLSDLLERQVGLIAGAEDEIRSLRDHLSLLSIFLEGINAQSDGTTPTVDQLVDQLRRVSWKAEDVVDQYILDVARHERKKYVKKFFTGSGLVSSKGELAKQSQDIKNTIEDILTNKERFGVQLDYGTSSYMTAQQNDKNALDQMRRNVGEENVVGFDQQTCEVMEMLMPKGGVEAKELRVVSIIGMGGLGKSTLARKIFTSMEIEMLFVT